MSETAVEIRADLDVVEARQRGRALAEELGFTPAERALIATAVSELARNILQYAREGRITFEAAEARGKRGMLIRAVDQGPGIPDLDLAMKDGFSTSRGLGLGLPGVRRLMDEFEIDTGAGKGTRITARKWIP